MAAPKAQVVLYRFTPALQSEWDGVFGQRGGSITGSDSYTLTIFALADAYTGNIYLRKSGATLNLGPIWRLKFDFSLSLLPGDPIDFPDNEVEICNMGPMFANGVRVSSIVVRVDRLGHLRLYYVGTKTSTATISAGGIYSLELYYQYKRDLTGPVIVQLYIDDMLFCEDIAAVPYVPYLTAPGANMQVRLGDFSDYEGPVTVTMLAEKVVWTIEDLLGVGNWSMMAV